MRFRVADNSHAEFAENISNNRKKYGVKIGDLVLLTIKSSKYGKFKKKKEAMTKGLVIRIRKRINRKDGTKIKFTDNAVVLINNFKDIEPLGTKIKGSIGLEILQDYNKFSEIIKNTNIKQFK